MGGRMGGCVWVGCVAVCQDDDDITCIGCAMMRALEVKNEPVEEEEQQLGGRRGGEGRSEILWWVDAWARWVSGG